MSYEIDSIKEINCPCGKGKIEIVTKSNEWNQVQTSTAILCDECKLKYEIIKKQRCHKPKHDYTVYYCKNKETDEKVQLNF